MPSNEATAFSWNGDTLVGAMPPSRTHPNSSPNAAIFLMKGPFEVRMMIRTLQGALLRAGHEMQLPLTEEQIAWHKQPLEPEDAT